MIWSGFLWSFFDYCSRTAAFSKILSVVEVPARWVSWEAKSVIQQQWNNFTIFSKPSQVLWLYQQSIKYFAIYEVLGNSGLGRQIASLRIPKILLFNFFQTQKPTLECVRFTYLQSTTYDVGPQRVNINQQFLHIYAFLFLNFQAISLEKLFEIASSWIFKCEFIAILSPL